LDAGERRRTCYDWLDKWPLDLAAPVTDAGQTGDTLATDAEA
jgi:hypothetical protein